MKLGFISPSLSSEVILTFDWSFVLAECIYWIIELYLPEQELTSSSFQKKEFVFYQFEKKRMEVDPFISDGEECEFQREYAEGRDGRKREYALKYMVATST